MDDRYKKLDELLYKPDPEPPKDVVIEEEEGDNRPFYSPYARENPGMKHMAAFARRVEAEEAGAVGIPYITGRFIDDNEHTIGFLERICKKWKIPNKELTKMKKFLMATGRFKINGRKRYFKDEDLYEALTSCELGKKYCELKDLKDWQSVIHYMWEHPYK